MKCILAACIAICLLSTFANGQNLWGAITMKNAGGYVGKFTITYKIDGAYQTVDSGKYPVGQVRSLPIPPEATNVLVQGYLDVFINSWSVVFADSIGTPQFKCYKIGGTTTNSNWNVVEDCRF